ncbi:hypothetical protein JTE90_027771 [Oedothorax gibbosus]|uniref:OTU domain-containing protein n=1 Tax=Oedothorax gibbosus TaxID=931172 RepID=A0AAV6V6C8_9ARAC|nr:hypothetical protein JTE90_027771 [Oedothorax gibbosus]
MSRLSPEVYLKAVCSDKQCQAVIYLTSLTPFVDCFRCGQQQDRRCLQNVQVLSDHEGMEEFLKYSLINSAVPKRGHDMVKVLGFSNYYCKLLSPFLTTYGMERSTGQPKLLTDMGRGDIFDCSSLSSRAFLIDPKHISIPGFGRDVTGSMDYLSETLERIKKSNGDQERLLPIYADGDGHCLVHAISRALVGRELFWHPLRSCLKRLFMHNLDNFKDLFQNFIDADEWHSIIEECDPEFQPPLGDFHGLRNIHIFGLANILRRPIILLDSWECMNKSGDYSGLFLPGFVPPSECRGEDNTLNKPICIAWSNKSHNHYIPLVGIQNMPLPVIPRFLIPNVFRMPQSEISNYIEFDENDNCVIGGNRVLSDNYIQCLVFAMETQFTRIHGVHPSLVADAKHFFYSNNIYLNPSTSTIIRQVRNVVNNGYLFRCSTCTGLNEVRLEQSWFQYGGICYTALKQDHQKFLHGASYELPIKEEEYLTCTYDSRTDSFIPDNSSFKMKKCSICQRSGGLKRVEPYINPEMKTSLSDKFSSRSLNRSTKGGASSSNSAPSTLPRIKVEWNEKTVEDVIPDFQLVNESILANAIDKIAESFVKKHFSGEEADNVLQSYISGEIYKTIGKSPTVASSDVSDAIEAIDEKLDSEEITLLETKLGNASSKIQSEPSTSQIHTVKLVSINGHEETLDLNEKGITYSQLQNVIQNGFSIPIPNQRIKMGFPPKVLEPPHGNEGIALPLKHGDRLIIENHPVQENKRFASTPYIRNTPSVKTTECNSELWKVVKTQPHLFKRRGLYFEEADQKHILTDMKHVQIPSFPNKLFSYNQKSDCLEVCLKPIGHFEMSPDFDSRVDQATAGESVTGYRMCPIMCLLPGRSNIKPNKTTKELGGTVETKSNQSSVDIGRIRKGPGVSLLASPEPNDMDVS